MGARGDSSSKGGSKVGEVPKWGPEVIAAPREVQRVTFGTNDVATSTPVDPEAEYNEISKTIRDN